MGSSAVPRLMFKAVRQTLDGGFVYLFLWIKMEHRYFCWITIDKKLVAFANDLFLVNRSYSFREFSQTGTEVSSYHRKQTELSCHQTLPAEVTRLEPSSVLHLDSLWKTEHPPLKHQQKHHWDRDTCDTIGIHWPLFGILLTPHFGPGLLHSIGA